MDTHTPDIRIHAFLESSRMTLYVDTSGDALFKRGVRQYTNVAPLRENLAAGILLLTGWQPGVPLLDPMCGSDLYGDELKAAHLNLENAGLRGAVTLNQANVLEISAPADHGVLVANLPYGERMGDLEELQELYPKLGDVLKKKFGGWNAYLFTSDLRMPKFIRLSVSRRTLLFNGAIECRLFEYKMVAGSNRT